MSKTSITLIGYSIVSPLHLLNFISYKKSLNNLDEAYVYISQYWSNNIIPERYLNYCKEENITIFYEVSEVVDLLERKEDIYLFVIKNLPIKLFLKKLKYFFSIKKIIIGDEGLSNYASHIYSIKATFKERSLIFSVYYCISIFLNYLLILFFSNKINRFNLFLDGQYSVNLNYVQWFKKAIAQMSKSNLQSIGNYDSHILFCTQPLIEIGKMNYSEYEEYMNKIEKHIKSMGYNLIIKKHPADKVYKYDQFKILNFDGVIEELVYLSNFHAVISCYSTSSILIKIIYNMDSYVVSFEELSFLDKNLQNLFKKFCIEMNDLRK